MNFIVFQKQFSPYRIFSLQDIRKNIPDFSYRQIDRWEKKEYIQKVKQGFYVFADQEITTSFLFLAAHRIYSPSYISLEKALNFYGLIPEETFQITSVSTKKTTEFETSIGNFRYRHISPRLFWGYRFTSFEQQKILMADPEKALLDFLFFHPELKTPDDFVEMRINSDSFRNHIDMQKFNTYLKAFENKSFTKRASLFLTTVSP